MRNRALPCALAAATVLVGNAAAADFDGIVCKKTHMSIGGGDYELVVDKTGESYKATYTFETFGPTPAFVHVLEGMKCNAAKEDPFVFNCVLVATVHADDPARVPPYGSVATRAISSLGQDTMVHSIGLRFSHGRLDDPEVGWIGGELSLEFPRTQCTLK
jgi:hypothetical protein